MKALRSFVSPWALAGLAVWIVVLGAVANWAIPVFANVGSGPGCESPPCQPNWMPTDWLPVLGTGVITATIVVAVLAGAVLLVRRRSVG